MVKALAHWLIFAVLVPLLPLTYVAFHLAIKGDAVELTALVSHGELLLVAAVLSARGVGEALTAGARSPVRIVAGGLAFIVYGLASYCYAVVADQPPDSQALPHVIRVVSLWLYGAAVAAGASCIAVREA
jgi:hypothetical protein